MRLKSTLPAVCGIFFLILSTNLYAAPLPANYDNNTVPNNIENWLAAEAIKDSLDADISSISDNDCPVLGYYIPRIGIPIYKARFEL